MKDASKAKSPGATGLSAKQNTDGAVVAPADKVNNCDKPNLIARLHRAGHTVHQGSNGDFTVCKYGLSHYCQDFKELQAIAVKLGVSNHG